MGHVIPISRQPAARKRTALTARDEARLPVSLRPGAAAGRRRGHRYWRIHPWVRSETIFLTVSVQGVETDYGRLFPLMALAAAAWPINGPMAGGDGLLA